MFCHLTVALVHSETIHFESLIFGDFGADVLYPQLKSVSVAAVCVSVLSETTDSTEEEWQSIADLATACRSILEALSREGEDQTHFYWFNTLIHKTILLQEKSIHFGKQSRVESHVVFCL